MPHESLSNKCYMSHTPNRNDVTPEKLIQPLKNKTFRCDFKQTKMKQPVLHKKKAMKSGLTQLCVRFGREYWLALRQHASTQLPGRSTPPSSELDAAGLPPLSRLRLLPRPGLSPPRVLTVEDPCDEDLRRREFLLPVPFREDSLSPLLLLGPDRRVLPLPPPKLCLVAPRSPPLETLRLRLRLRARRVLSSLLSFPLRLARDVVLRLFPCSSSSENRLSMSSDDLRRC